MPYNKKTTGVPNVDRVTDDIYSILNKIKGGGTGSGTVSAHNDLTGLNTGDFMHLTAAIFTALTGGFSENKFRFMTNWRLRNYINADNNNRPELWLEYSATPEVEESWIWTNKFYPKVF